VDPTKAQNDAGKADHCHERNDVPAAAVVGWSEKVLLCGNAHWALLSGPSIIPGDLCGFEVDIWCSFLSPAGPS